jgi:succinoglycan biosynthesis transport protein ExoP
MEASMQNERAKLIARMKSDYQTAKLREAMLTEAYKRQTALVSNQAYKSIEYNLLKGEADANRQLYEQMLGKVKEAGITSALRTGTARVVDSADTPVNPIAPNFLMASGLGLLGGLLLGSAFAVLKERIDSSVKSPGENATGLNVPEIGVIPLAGTEPRQVGQNKAYGLTTSGRLELLTWEQRDSFVAESFRSTLHSLIGNHGSPQLHRVVAITSPNSMEGKTTVATNIAIAFAEAGVRVLLVDGDLRRPRLHDVFGVDRGPGLTDLLTATELTDELLKTTIRQTNVAGVHLLTSGTQREMITALLYSERMNPLLEKLRQTFHFVLIDTPPTLPVPDARVIGAKCDGVVIVTAAGQTDRKEILLTGQRFAEDRTRVLGTILNKWVPRSDMAHYYRSYANSYLRSAD